MPNIGFIGLGRMGQAICSRLLDKGQSLYIYNRTSGKASSLIERGAIWCDSPSLVGDLCNIVILCLSDETATERLLSEKRLDGSSFFKPETIIIDTGTISPSSADRNNDVANINNLHYVSCPVSGGIEGAINGSLAAIVAARESIHPILEPFIELFADKITWLTDNSEAQKLKIINNLAESINLIGAFEVISLGMKQGLSLDKLYSVLTTCRGRSAYMDVALNFLISNQKDSDVSLAVRCKDLQLANTLSGVNDSNVLSKKTIELFHAVHDFYSGEHDQCALFNFINRG